MTSPALARGGHSGRSNRARHRIDAAAWDRFVDPVLLDAEAVPDWGPEILDAGFGTGDSVIAVARQRPTTRILGVETYNTGVLRVAKTLAQQGESAVRLSNQDVREILPSVAPDSLEQVRFFFPDPWPKRRHAARRLIDAKLIETISARLRIGGLFWFATDADHYADAVLSLAAGRDDLQRQPEPPTPRPDTKYAAMATAAGRNCRDFVWRRVS